MKKLIKKNEAQESYLKSNRRSRKDERLSTGTFDL